MSTTPTSPNPFVVRLEPIDPELKVEIEFTRLSAIDLADLIRGTNEFVVRSAIAWMKNGRSSPETEVEEVFAKLGRSFAGFYMDWDYPYREKLSRDWFRYYPDIRNFDVVNDELFSSWIETSLRESSLEIKRVEQGSIIFVFTAFAVANLLSMPVDYSLMKDMISFSVQRLQKGLRQPPPKNTLESVPKILSALAKNKNVKKFRVRAEGLEIDVLLESNRAVDSP